MRFVKDEEYLKYCGLKLVSALGKEDTSVLVKLIACVADISGGLHDMERSQIAIEAGWLCHKLNVGGMNHELLVTCPGRALYKNDAQGWSQWWRDHKKGFSAETLWRLLADGQGGTYHYFIWDRRLAKLHPLYIHNSALSASVICILAALYLRGKLPQVVERWLVRTSKGFRYKVATWVDKVGHAMTAVAGLCDRDRKALRAALVERQDVEYVDDLLEGRLFPKYKAGVQRLAEYIEKHEVDLAGVLERLMVNSQCASFIDATKPVTELYVLRGTQISMVYECEGCKTTASAVEEILRDAGKWPDMEEGKWLDAGFRQMFTEED